MFERNVEEVFRAEIGQSPFQEDWGGLPEDTPVGVTIIFEAIEFRLARCQSNYGWAMGELMDPQRRR